LSLFSDGKVFYIELAFLDQHSEKIFNFLNDYFNAIVLDDFERLSKLLKFYAAEKSNALIDEAFYYGI